jgi:RNA recognition motif-containing protein
MKKIFVGNFSFSLSEGELRSMFEPFGAVDSATVVTDRATGRSRGFGFVEMPSNEEAEKAIAALNGKDSGGRALTVNEARPKVGGGGGGYRGGGGGSRGGGGGRDRGNSRDDYQGHARQPREPRW